MTPRELLDAFETLAEAPEGVRRLRELVLRLAVRGKLVVQDPAEEAASRSLVIARNMLSERAEGVRRGLWKMTAEVKSDEVPFSLPPGWAWARINDTGFYINGLAFKPSDWMSSGTPIVRIQNLSNPSNPFNYAQGDFHDDVLVRHGDLLVSWSATLEAFIWQGVDGVLNQHIFRAQPCEAIVIRSFLYYLLRQSIRDIAESEHAHGLVMPHINRGPFLAHVVAIPPLAEQHRIVARVDELMALLERLETTRAVRDEVRRAARDAALAALRDSEDTEAFELAWTRISGRMDSLFATPEDVAPLRQTLRQLAIRGRLVPQAPSDIAASIAIAKAQEQLASQPSVRGRSATMERIRGDAALSVGEWGTRVVPVGWSETPLSAVTRLESGHTPDRNISHYWEGDFFWIGIQDARRHRGGTIFETEKRISRAGIDNSAARLLPAGTVCLSRTASVGYTVIMGVSMCTSQDFVNFVCTSAIASRYLQLTLEAEYAALKRFAKGAVHLTIYFPEVKAFHVLLPPVAEQHRIVAKVDTLMALCDDLEARLAAARELQTQFAAAAVHHLDV